MFNPAKKSFLEDFQEALQENPPPQGAKDATPIGAPTTATRATSATNAETPGVLAASTPTLKEPD